MCRAAVAGINGTFFADARLRGSDTTLIGPSQNPTDTTLVPDLAEDRLPRLINRPIVLWGPKKIAIVPFQPGTMNAADPFKAFMPDYTELFLAGAWIVHGGVPRTTDEMRPYSAGDFSDPRRRAFFGISESGEIILGASLDVVDTEKLAAAAAAAGAKEAVLLDSGFSTSLCYNGKVVVSGHTSSGLVSRAVPHAIVVTGTLEPPTDAEVLAAFNQADSMIIPPGAPGSETGPATGKSTHRRKKRKRRPQHPPDDDTRPPTAPDTHGHVGRPATAHVPQRLLAKMEPTARKSKVCRVRGNLQECTDVRYNVGKRSFTTFRSPLRLQKGATVDAR